MAIRASLDCTELEFLAIMGEVYDLRIDAERFMDRHNKADYKNKQPGQKRLGFFVLVFREDISKSAQK
jgi:hypothetical protein